MNDSSSFRSQSDEVRLLLKQLTEVHAELQQISKKVTMIERHIGRTFPREHQEHRNATQAARETGEVAPLGDGEARKAFDDLSQLWRDGNRSQVHSRLEDMPVEHVREIALAIGLRAGKRVSRTNLHSQISGRLAESSMLRTNVTVEQQRKAEVRDPTQDTDT